MNDEAKKPPVAFDLLFVMTGTVYFLLIFGRQDALRETAAATFLAGALLIFIARMIAMPLVLPGAGGLSKGWEKALYALAAFLFLAALAMPRYSVVDAGSDYRVPFQLPGPADGWSEGMTEEITVDVPGGKPVLVRLNLFESHGHIPPKLEVLAGGVHIKYIQVAPGNGAVFPKWREEGRPSGYSVFIAPRFLTQEKTPVVFRPAEGSWIVIKSVEVYGLPAVWEFWRQIMAPWNYLLFWVSAILILANWVAAAGEAGLGQRRLAMHAMMWGLTAIVSAGCLLGLAAFVEIKTPWITYQEGNFRSPEMFYGSKYLRDRDLGWILLPKFTAYTLENSSSEPRVFYHVNWKGYRSLEGEPHLPVKGKVMMIGDSFTQGAFLSQEETMPAILTERLGEYVYNFGVGGYSTDQEYTTFMKWIDKIEVEWVVLQFFVNDVIYTERPKMRKVRKPLYPMVDGKVDFEGLVPLSESFVEEENRKLYETLEKEKTFCCFSPKKATLGRRIANRTLSYISGLYYPGGLIATMLYDVRHTRAFPAPDHMDVHEGILEDPEKYDVQFGQVFQFISRMKEETERRGLKFLTLYVPDVLYIRGQDVPARANFKNKFMAMCKERGIPCLDPSEKLIEQSQYSGMYFMDDGHFSPDGARVTAELLADVIQGKEKLQ